MKFKTSVNNEAMLPEFEYMKGSQVPFNIMWSYTMQFIYVESDLSIKGIKFNSGLSETMFSMWNWNTYTEYVSCIEFLWEEL